MLPENSRINSSGFRLLAANVCRYLSIVVDHVPERKPSSQRPSFPPEWLAAAGVFGTPTGVHFLLPTPRGVLPGEAPRTRRTWPVVASMQRRNSHWLQVNTEKGKFSSCLSTASKSLVNFYCKSTFKRTGDGVVISSVKRRLIWTGMRRRANYGDQKHAQ